MPKQSSVIRDDDDPPTSNGLSLPRRTRLLPSAMAAATTALIVAIAASSAPAQQASESPPAAWGVDCSGVGKMLDCRTVLRHRETGQFLVSEMRSPDGKIDMVVMLPPGLNLTEPVLVKVDNGAPERLIQTCTNVGCSVTLTEKLIANMRTGSDLKITAQDANKKPIEMRLPLLGFGRAYDVR
jgi:invasion protein IalB